MSTAQRAIYGVARRVREEDEFDFLDHEVTELMIQTTLQKVSKCEITAEQAVAEIHRHLRA